MNTLLLEHFDQLISTPEDVEQLNQSILDLAIRGKLTCQEPGDEPTKELLKRIKEEKGRLGIYQPSIPVKEEEKSLDLPKGWEWVRWDDVSLQIADVDHKMPDEIEEGIPYVSPRDFKGKEEIAFSTAKKISRKAYDDLASKIRPERGDIIFPRYGTIGVNRFVSVDFEFLASYSCAIVKHMKGLMNPRYVYFYSISPFLKQETQKYINKTTQANVGIKSIQKFVFPLPPLAEQQRIVARVEELFAQTRLLAEQLSHSRTELDHLNESALAHLLASETPEEFNERWGFIAEHFDLLTNAPEHIAPLRQSILELAVRGKLTRREQGDEPAKELLKRSNEKKSKLVEEGKFKREKTLLPIKQSEKPFELPAGWEWVKLGEIGNAINFPIVDGPFGSSVDTKTDYIDSGVPVIRMVNIKPYRFLPDNLKYVSQEKYETLRRHNVLSGDVLFSKVGAGIGEACLVPPDFGYGMLSTTGISRFRVGEIVLPEYLNHFLNSHKDEFAKMAARTAQPFLNMGMIRNVLFPLPPLAEQERIVKRVEQLLGWCDALEAQLKSAEEERGRLVESVLARVSQT
jgi:type I restriction enzyme, S subunit